MPYVTPEQRQVSRGPSADVGELTYDLQQVLHKYLEARRVLGGRLRYQDLAACLGALEGCKVDFVRRLLVPYEELKQTENGDCWSKQLIGAVSDKP